MAVKPESVKLLELNKVVDIIENEIDDKLLKGEFGYRYYKERSEKVIMVGVDKISFDGFFYKDIQNIQKELKERYCDSGWDCLTLKDSTNTIMLEYIL